MVDKIFFYVYVYSLWLVGNVQNMNSTKQEPCVVDIRGQVPDLKDPVDVGFHLLKFRSNLLPKKKQRQLKMRVEQQAQSVTELAALTERVVSHMPRSWQTLDKYNLVRMQSVNKMLCPKVIYQDFLVVVNNEK